MKTETETLSFPKTRTIEVLGKPIVVKNYKCRGLNSDYEQKPSDIKLQLSIVLTEFCNGRCPFCIAKPTDNPAKLDMTRLEKMLLDLKSENVVRGISFTGGEPFTDVSLLNEAVSMIFDIFGYDCEIAIETNGTNLARLHKIKDLQHIDAIHVSRHHYLDEKNDELFCRRMLGREELKDIVSGIAYKDLFVLNCVMLRSYIGTRDEAHRYLDDAIRLQVPKVAFITCYPVNSFSRDNFVNFDDILNDSDKHLLFTRGFVDFDRCRCRDGIYTNGDADLIEFYGRTTNMDRCDYCRGFSIRPDGHLYSGFSREIIV